MKKRRSFTRQTTKQIVRSCSSLVSTMESEAMVCIHDGWRRSNPVDVEEKKEHEDEDEHKKWEFRRDGNSSCGWRHEHDSSAQITLPHIEVGQHCVKSSCAGKVVAEEVCAKGMLVMNTWGGWQGRSLGSMESEPLFADFILDQLRSMNAAELAFSNVITDYQTLMKRNRELQVCGTS